MQFIEALKLRSKLFFLLVLVLVGLIAIGIIGAVNIKSMKKNVDALYFGSLAPITELNDILQIYQGSLLSTLYMAKNSDISTAKTNTLVNNALKKVDENWKDYESHFKRDEEMKYVKYVSQQINITNAYFRTILHKHTQEDGFKNISVNEFNKHILHIYNITKKLINYETEIAKYERGKFLDRYDSTLIEVGLVLLIIIFTVVIISIYVFKSIQKDHTMLEITTKKLKRANKKLEDVSYTDSLTELHNRRYFNFIYDRELNRARRAKSQLTFMMLDIDFFKQYNDTYGHIEGDFALKSVAKALKDTLQRPSDFVFRLGGEEFGVLLTDTDEENSAKLAQKICDSVRDRGILHKSSKAGKFVTISIGVVSCKADDSLDENVLITLADKMLYEAKESGRDCFVISCDISGEMSCNIENELVDS